MNLLIDRERTFTQCGVRLPVIDRLILNKTFVGYTGELNLVEDIYSKALLRQREY